MNIYKLRYVGLWYDGSAFLNIRVQAKSPKDAIAVAMQHFSNIRTKAEWWRVDGVVDATRPHVIE